MLDDQKAPREVRGDDLSGPAAKFSAKQPRACGAFKTLFQFATAGHEGLLLGEGLLNGSTRLLGGQPPPASSLHDALVIDDYFALSCEDVDPLLGIPESEVCEVLRSSRATSCVLIAQAAYDREGLAGSSHKDDFGSLLYTVAGAQVDSTLPTVLDGQVVVGTPLQKRLALSYVSLKTASLPAISEELASCLSGSWISVLQFRKCFSSILDFFFLLGRKDSTADSGSRLRFLPRKAANEISLLAALAPVLTSNIAVPYESRAFCTDASLEKGAVCETEVGLETSEALWLSACKKGKYTLLQPEAKDSPSDTPEAPAETPSRPLGLLHRSLWGIWQGFFGPLERRVESRPSY